MLPVTKIGAQILRRILKTELPTANVILSSEPLDLGGSFEDVSHNGSLGQNHENISLFVWSKAKGLKPLNAKIGEISGSNYAHSSRTHIGGERLIDALMRLDYTPEIVGVLREGSSEWEGGHSNGSWNYMKLHQITETEIKKFVEKEEAEQRDAILVFFGLSKIEI